jgi:predicted Zn-dependent protease with MMP-like domain
MSVPVKDFLSQRRNRALGSIMGHLERERFDQLPQGERDRTRQVVLDAINGYHDSVLDLLKAEDSNTIRNDEVIRLLQRLEQNLNPHVRRAASA